MQNFSSSTEINMIVGTGIVPSMGYSTPECGTIRTRGKIKSPAFLGTAVTAASLPFLLLAFLSPTNTAALRVLSSSSFSPQQGLVRGLSPSGRPSRRRAVTVDRFTPPPESKRQSSILSSDCIQYIDIYMYLTCLIYFTPLPKALNTRLNPSSTYPLGCENTTRNHPLSSPANASSLAINTFSFIRRAIIAADNSFPFSEFFSSLGTTAEEKKRGFRSIQRKKAAFTEGE